MQRNLWLADPRIMLARSDNGGTSFTAGRRRYGREAQEPAGLGFAQPARFVAAAGIPALSSGAGQLLIAYFGGR